MSLTTSTAIFDRARRGLERRLHRFRDSLEWRASQSLHGRGPWCRNRWGHRYQAMSLSEYHYVRDGNPETHEARLIENLLDPGMTVIDVGANHGLFSMEAAQLVGPTGRIDAFEPAPETRSLLERNLRANGLERIVRVVPSALAAERGTARLRVHRDLSGLNTLADNDITWNHRILRADTVVEVPLTTLDDHADAEALDHIDFLKIDVEGFELAVLRGARRLLTERRIGWVMLEVGDLTCANAHVRPAAVLDELTTVGYALHEITSVGEIGPRVRAFPTGPFSANYLAGPETGQSRGNRP